MAYYTSEDLRRSADHERSNIVRWIYEYAEKVERETGIYGVSLATVIRDVAGKINTFSDRDPEPRRSIWGTNVGHGHVWPRPDGNRARCGGPTHCDLCAQHAEQFNNPDTVSAS